MEHVFSKKVTFREFLKFVSPAIISMVFISLYTIIDGIFVSKLIGSNALASINITLPIVNLLCGIGIMFGTGGSALVSISMGENNYKEANNRFSLILLTTLIIGIVISIIGVIFNKEIFRFLGATDVLMDYCRNYGIIIIVASPIYMLKMLFEYFTRTDGAFKFSLFTSVLGGVINVVFDYIFIAKFDLGIAGAALATILGSTIAMILSVLYFLTKKSSLKYVLPKFNFSVLRESALNGSSEMVTELSSAITTFMFNYVAMKFAGENGVAAVTIILYANFLMISTYLGFVSGIAPLISYNYGAKNEEKIKETHNYSKKFILSSSILVFIICFIFSPIIVNSFVDKSSDVFNLALNGLKIFSFAFLFTGLNIYASGLFTAFSNGKISAIVSFARAFVFILIGFLTLPSLFGINGLWLIVPFAELITTSLSILFIKKYRISYLY